MAQAGHRERPEWRQAMDLVERVYRLTSGYESGAGQRLATQTTRAAASIPARMIAGGPDVERALLELETLLTVAIRLGHLPEPQAAPVLALIDALLGIDAPAVPIAPAPPGAPASPVVPAPVASVPVAPAPVPVEPLRSRPQPAPSSGADHLIVDGCNFLGRAAGYDLGDPDARDRLLFRLQEYAHDHPAHHVAVFFDGQRASRKLTAGVTEHVTSGHRPADDVMVDHLRAMPPADRRRTTLVTDDRELAARARKEGVRVESVAWLSTRLSRKPIAGPPRTGMSRTELQEWEDFFNRPPQRPGKG